MSADESNPYNSPVSKIELDRVEEPSKRIHQLVLVLIALLLLYRGFGHAGWCWRFWPDSFSNMLSNSHSTAVFLEFVIYGTLSLGAGCLLFYRPRIGWWIALIYWFWYISCSIIMVHVADVFSWTFPFRPTPEFLAIILHPLQFTLPVLLLGMGPLMWGPIRRLCDVRRSNQWLFAAGLFVVTFLVAVALYWLLNQL